MRVERINDNQLKYTFMTDDLAERDICISELSYSSEKTQQLFQEVMHLAQFESGFITQSTSLMLEAMRVGVDSLVIVVTKVTPNSKTAQGEVSVSLVPAAKSECKYKRIMELLTTKKTPLEDSYSVFSFEDIEILAASVSRLPANFHGESAVYKMDGRVFLMMKNATQDKKTTSHLESVLYEYGKKHISNGLSHQYLLERADVLIGENAVQKLRVYFHANEIEERIKCHDL